ncbi:MAG: zeta toxin family protein [Alphaproteobacteria bacterium]|nr:zeta toxin family protein [Alphaproteobacteria bacterium]
MKVINNIRVCVAACVLLTMVSCEKIKATSIVPQEIVTGFLKDYTPDERALIDEDLKGIRALTFRGLTKPRPSQYIATAGGPGAGKSTILETYIQDNKIENIAYVDPDQRALRFMINTYYLDLTLYAAAKAKSYQDLLAKGYDKWRGGSNYIANTLLNEAILGGYSVMHGTTSTGGSVDQLYDKLKGRGYEITILVCASSLENRQKALEWRAKDQGFVQSDPEDVATKGKALFERLPVYLAKADHVLMYWSDDFAKGARLVARFDKGMGVKVLNPDIKEIEKLYEEVRREKGAKLPRFQDLIRGAK